MNEQTKYFLKTVTDSRFVRALTNKKINNEIFAKEPM